MAVPNARAFASTVEKKSRPCLVWLSWCATTNPAATPTVNHRMLFTRCSLIDLSPAHCARHASQQSSGARPAAGEDGTGAAEDFPRPLLDGVASASGVVLHDELHVTGHGDLDALRTTEELHLELVELGLEVARELGQHVDVTAGGRDLEGLGALAACLDVHELTRLHAERGAIDELTVDEDVAVHDELAGLRDGAREAGAEHDGVETHLE